MTPYFLQLASRLADGAARFSAPFREKHAAFVCSRQLDDGGFRGRDDASDLYYTSFALRNLAVLDALPA
jgi:geranylgeranyl transferase type-2 subunit beta